MKKINILWIIVLLIPLVYGELQLPFFPDLNPFTGTLQTVTPVNSSVDMYYDSNGILTINQSLIYNNMSIQYGKNTSYKPFSLSSNGHQHVALTQPRIEDTNTWNTTAQMITAANSTGLLINWTTIISDTNTWNTSAQMIRATQDTFVNKTGDSMSGDLDTSGLIDTSNLVGFEFASSFWPFHADTALTAGFDTGAMFNLTQASYELWLFRGWTGVEQFWKWDTSNGIVNQTGKLEVEGNIYSPGGTICDATNCLNTVNTVNTTAQMITASNSTGLLINWSTKIIDTNLSHGGGVDGHIVSNSSFKTSNVVATEFTTLQSVWAFAYASGLTGGTNTGLYFDAIGGELGYQYLGTYFWKTNLFGTTTTLGTSFDTEMVFSPGGANTGSFKWMEDEDYFKSSDEWIFEDNVNVSGNIIGNQIYGEMWYHNHTATNLNFAVDGTYYLLFFRNSTLNGFTFDGLNNLTALIAGKYKSCFMASGDGQNNHEYYTSVFVNEINQYQCEAYKKMSAGGDIVTQNGCCFIDLTINDKISLRSADIGSTGTGNYYSSNINLVRIGDTS